MRGTRSCRCEAPVRRCVGFFESAEAAAPEVPPKPSAAGSAERGGPTSYHRVCRTGTPDYGTGWGCGGSALRGSSASGAGASIARGCPPRTSPPPGGGFAGRSPHPLPLRNVRFAQNPYGKRKGDQETKENRKRDVTLTIRMTQAEKDAIIVNAMHAGKNLTDYILSVNDRAIISPPPDLSPLLRELKRIGTNINQVAAKVNSGVSYVPGLREVAEQQAEIIRRLRTLTEDRTWQP